MKVKTELVEKRKRRDAKQDELKAIFAEAGDEMDMDKIKSIDGDSAAKVDAIRTLDQELKDLTDEISQLALTVQIEEGLKGKGREGDEIDPEFEEWKRQKMTHGGDEKGKRREQQGKSLGALFTESKAYKERVTGGAGPESEIDIDLKTLMTTSAGWAPETTRGPRVVDFVTRPLQVIDTIPQTTTNQTAITFMEETTFTNAAVEIDEGAEKPEATLALTERTDPVRKIAVWLPVTDEQLEDVNGVQGYIENRLGFMVMQRLDTQVLIGDGTAPNLSGILDRSGIQTQAKGADPVPDAVYKAMVKVRINGAGNGGAIPNVIYMNPLDWQDVRLLRTADGIYIWGSPSDPGIARMWGLPVVEAEGLTQNTGLVGDTTYTELAIKKGMDIQISNSHSDYFIKNKQAIRAEIRAAFVVYRPAAWCSVTGI